MRDDRTPGQVLEDMGDPLCESTPGFDAKISIADILQAAANAGLAYARSKLTPLGTAALMSGQEPHASVTDGGSVGRFKITFLMGGTGRQYASSVIGEVGFFSSFGRSGLSARIVEYPPSRNSLGLGETLKEAFDDFLRKGARKFYPGFFQG